MTIIRESISFVRGLDPKRSLNIGMHHDPNFPTLIEKYMEEGLKEFEPANFVKTETREDGSRRWIKYRVLEGLKGEDKILYITVKKWGLGSKDLRKLKTKILELLSKLDYNMESINWISDGYYVVYFNTGK